MLQGITNTRWQGMKHQVTWKKGIKRIREAFVPKRPPYKVYIDLFAEKQDPKTPFSATREQF